MDKKELEFTTRLTREDVAGLIEAAIEGLKDGKLKVQKSNEVLVLDVPRVIDLEIEASIDGERAEFEIELSWRTNRAENPDLPPGRASGTIDLPKVDAPAVEKAKAADKPATKEQPKAKKAAAKKSGETRAKPRPRTSAAKAGSGKKT